MQGFYWGTLTRGANPKTHKWIHLHIRIHVPVHLHLHIHVRIHIHIHIHIHIRIHIPTVLCICIYVCMYVCAYVCMHAYVYVCNAAPCLVLGCPPRPPNKWGTFNVRQDTSSRAPYEYNRTSTISSYLSTSWLIPANSSSMLGRLPRTIAL